MNFDVAARTIYLARHGSHAYGLATPTSDLDVKGVCIEPARYHFGFTCAFEQQEKLAAKGNDCDSVVYSLKKFAKLAADCNPSIIEVLFVNDSDVLACDEYGEELRAMRDDFISKKARFTFSGYAHSQLERIERHRRWLTREPPKLPTRTEFGLPERTLIPKDQLAAAQAAIEKKLARWNLADMTDLDPAARIVLTSLLNETLAEMQMASDSSWRAAGRTLGYSENFLGLLDQERRYKGRMDEWNSYQEWMATRNPARAELERKFGYDTKHGSHLLRLMRMCAEILAGKGVIVKRPDAEELLAIKQHGAMSYDALIAEARRLDVLCAELYSNKSSTLRKEPDRAKIDSAIVNITQRYLSQHG
jgi:predicted nucleotidyltransferase